MNMQQVITAIVRRHGLAEAFQTADEFHPQIRKQTRRCVPAEGDVYVSEHMKLWRDFQVLVAHGLANVP